MEVLRVNSSKLFFANVAKDLAPSNPTLSSPPAKNCIPEEPGQPPPLERFSQWFDSLLGVEQPVPPAVNDPQWHQFISTHPLPVIQSMGRDFSAKELLHVIFPTTNYSDYKCPTTGVHDPMCTLCTTLKKQAAHWKGRDDLHNAPPTHFPSGKAQPAAAGEDVLAYIRWARHPDPSITIFQYRMSICDHLAPVLSNILREGRMPDGALNYRSIPLPKPSSDMNANYADPSKLYRFLAMAPLLTKILGLALDARFIHWATKYNHIDTSFQGASMPYLDTEHLPLHFMECIKAMWEKKFSVASIFVDLRKAYDMVHPDLMSTILARLGVPPNLVKLLHHWNTSRIAILHVNGATSQPIPTKGGLGQGDVLSPILFCLFMAPLNKYLRSNPSLGITPISTRKVGQAFIDDLHAFTRTDPAHIQATINAIYKWANAFGMQLQVGPAKTALMLHPSPHAIEQFYRGALNAGAFNPLPSDPSTPPSTPITLPDGTVIPWVTEYKYLGYPATNSIDGSTLLGRIVRGRRESLRTLLAYNSIVRKLPPSTFVQLLKTNILDSYLLSAIAPTPPNVAQLDAVFHTAMRAVLGYLPESTPTAILHTASGIPSALFSIIRSRLKVYLQTKFPRFDSPLPSFLAEQIHAQSGAWITTTNTIINKYSATLGDINDPATILEFAKYSPGKTPTPSDLTRLAAVYARGFCFLHLLNSRQLKGCTQLNTTMSSRPAPTPIQHFYDVNFCFAHSAQGIMFPSKSTHLSTLGPYTSSNLLVRVSTPDLTTTAVKHLTFARLGALSLSLPGCPYAPARWKPTITNSSGKTPTYGPIDFRAAAHGKPCPLCTHPHTDVWHIIHECPHPAVVKARGALHGAATQYLTTLSRQILHAQPQYVYNNPHSALVQAHNALSDIPTPPRWDTPTGKSMLYRLLLVIPWPAAAVDDNGALHAKALGHQFDITVAANNRLHGLANSWTLWASRNLASIISAWRIMVDKC